MTDETTNLLLEQLRAIRASQDRLTEGFAGFKQLLSSVESQIGLIHSDLGHLHGDLAIVHNRIDKVERRLGMIEKRLGPVDA